MPTVKEHKCKAKGDYGVQIVLHKTEYKGNTHYGWYLRTFGGIGFNLTPAKFCHGCGKKLEVPKINV